jgi:hypothetical protein
MSMIFGLTTLGDANIARVPADPPRVLRVIAPDDPEAYARARTPTAAPADLARAAGEGESTDLDQARHGILISPDRRWRPAREGPGPTRTGPVVAPRPGVHNQLTPS